MSFPGRQQLPVNGSRNNLTPYQNRLHLGNITSPRPSPSSGNNDLSQSSRSASMTSPIYSAQPRQFSQEQMSPVGQGFPPQHNIDPFQARPSLPYAPHQVINQSSPVFQNHYQDSLLGPTLQSRFNLPSATPSAINQATRSPQYPHPNSFAQPRLSSRLQASTSIDMWGVNVENSLLDRRFPNNNLQHSLNAGSFSPESLYSFGHRDQHIHPSDAFVPHPSALVGTHRPQQGIPMRIPLQNAEENAAKGEMISGATSMRVDASTGSEIFRRSTRERKPAQHFGHSSRSDELEDLLAAAEPQVITPIVEASKKPTRTVRLPAHHAKKRTAALLDNDDEAESVPSPSEDGASKRRRLSQAAPEAQAAPRPKAAATAKVAVKCEEDSRPEPRGQPEVWAEERQALCESLPYYQSYQSSAYTWGSSKDFAGYAYGYLLDNDNEEYGYMDEKVVITRLGGGMKANKEGHMEQTEDHSSSSNRVAPFFNNMRSHLPVVLIVGSKNSHCPVKVPHRYNVLGLYHVTDIWSEQIKGKTVCRARFEMVNLKSPSWCGIKGAPLPGKPDYGTKASEEVCDSCGTASKQVLTTGWTCLNEDCAKFSLIDKTPQVARAWNPAFINERTKWPAHIKAPMMIKPEPPTAPLGGSLMETSQQAWKGMVCRECGRCNSRTNWDDWKCATEGCTYEVPIRYNAIPSKALQSDHAFEAEGHAIPFDKYLEPVIRRDAGFQGYWRVMRYELSPGNSITHYLANQVINRQPGGADEILIGLQSEKLGMQRFALESCAMEGEMITKHFGINFGLPYKYVVAVDSKGFSEAPPVIMNALNRLTWAGKDAIRDGSYRPFNELLCLGYMENQSIGMHDDGEKDLGPDIASLSLGGAATMSFRIKAKHWLAKGLTAANYNPELPVIRGSQGWKQRIKANDFYKAGRMTEYEAAKKELFKLLDDKNEKRKKHAPVVLFLELRHGDMVVMHGDQIQKIYEHGVQPKGKLRYGLTGRYIKPENIPVEEHWKGNFTIAPDKVYDGDVALFQEHHPEEDSD